MKATLKHPAPVAQVVEHRESDRANSQGHKIKEDKVVPLRTFKSSQTINRRREPFLLIHTVRR